MRIYLETTIFNRYFEDGREYNAETKRLFERFEDRLDEPFTSVAVIDELEDPRTPEPKRSQMIDLVRRYDIQVLQAREDVYELAQVYVEMDIIPKRFEVDGIHIAMAAIYEMDCIVSLNFHHINKLKTKTAAEIVNRMRGYSNPYICTPMEVIDDDE
jgi:predicted nucleic acid-binding protein